MFPKAFQLFLSARASGYCSQCIASTDGLHRNCCKFSSFAKFSSSMACYNVLEKSLDHVSPSSSAELQLNTVSSKYI